LKRSHFSSGKWLLSFTAGVSLPDKQFLFMFIKSTRFSDEETLLEYLFDFGLGEPAPEVQQLITDIDKELSEHTGFQDYRASLTDEEDIMELDAEERMIRLAERLMERYTSFETEKQQLFGILDDNRTLLYSMDLY
jgi:hypothetical protein